MKFISSSLLTLIMSFFLNVINGQAQQLNDENDDLLSSKELSVKEYSTRTAVPNFIQKTPNQVEIYQQGNINVANVNQHNPGGDMNIVFVTQTGNYNGAEVIQNGSGNNSAINQDGNFNQYKVQVSGNDNNSNVTQNGNYNVLDHSLIGNNMNYELIQNGNNNRLMHSDFGSQSGPPQIIQEGNNMNLRIEQR